MESFPERMETSPTDLYPIYESIPDEIWELARDKEDPPDGVDIITEWIKGEYTLICPKNDLEELSEMILAELT